MTQAELANLINRSESSVRKYEKGLTEIPHSIIEKIANILGVSLADLLGIGSIAEQGLELAKQIKQDTAEYQSELDATLLDNFHCLNVKGQEKALEQVNLLTKIPEYQKENH